MKFRIEHDALGDVRVPENKYWGAQTERSLNNFKIGPAASMPGEIIHAFAIVKKSAALVNNELDIFEKDKANVIISVCDEILDHKLDDQFPLVIWQTGSGTQTNMNVNEVIANRGHVLNGGDLSDEKKFLSPVDDVNKSQSSNDTFPTALHIAAYQLTVENTLKGLKQLRDALYEKSDLFSDIVKLGRTHFMDATPVTLGQEFSGYTQQIDNGIDAIENALGKVALLALGGTAVGTGLNAPEKFDELTALKIAELTGYPFKTAPNKFEALATNDAIVELSGAFKRVAVSLMKIGNDIRMLSSGPRGGIGEIFIPSNESGSSIMPGKVNPTQAEAVTMVAAQVMGNDVAIGIAGSNGQFELNVYRPVIAANIIQSARLLGDVSLSFCNHCIKGIKANKTRIDSNLKNSLMLVTSLNPHIGYYKSAEIAMKAYKENTTLKEAAMALGYVTEKEFDEWVDPSRMV
ncbi:class II fumarate hydratase [Saccharicrinis sp. FJH62]|uniref:class II fumarate hydratase n=1 Tax=Saccharicrinis sp. FJH62 TaxID=3344657 RepID=UPI0035D40239